MWSRYTVESLPLKFIGALTYQIFLQHVFNFHSTNYSLGGKHFYDCHHEKCTITENCDSSVNTSLSILIFDQKSCQINSRLLLSTARPSYRARQRSIYMFGSNANHMALFLKWFPE